MYEETIRVEDGSRLRIEVGIHQFGINAFHSPIWAVRVWRAKPKCRIFKVLIDSTVDRIYSGPYAEQVKSALYSAWLEIKPEPIK